MQEIATKIIDKLGLNKDTEIKRKIRGFNGITVNSLILSLISAESIPKAAQLLGYSEGPFKSAIHNTLLPLEQFAHRRENIFGKGSLTGRVSWRFDLLKLVGYKHCNKCDKVKPFTEYHLNSKNKTGLESECKACKNFRNTEDKEYISLRTPKWSELLEISDFYSNCPSGSHVDHIIPLRGKNVSGLHVINNLQYLTAKDNIIKGNKFLIE